MDWNEEKREDEERRVGIEEKRIGEGREEEGIEEKRGRVYNSNIIII